MTRQLLDKSCKNFLVDLASASPTPGGGGACALAGAISAALTSMVANLTLSNKKYAAVEHTIQPILISAEILRSRMEALVAADAAVFKGFMKALKMPKNTEEEKSARANALEVAAYDAAEVPLKIADSCMEVLEIAAKIVLIGNKSAITDATVAAFLARAALRSACYNVQCNLLLIKDQDYVTKTETYMLKLNHKAEDIEEQVVRDTDEAMK
jgi:methenyltetrahydrofolate cyclohydrolase